MKNLFKFLLLGSILTFASESKAQNVTIENQTTCGYNVKANVGSGPCRMGMGPMIGIGALTMSSYPIPAWATHVTGYGINRTGVSPMIAGDPGCGFPGIITLPASHPNACAGKITVFEFHGPLLIIK